MTGFSRSPSRRFRLFGAFVVAAVVIGACNDITAPSSGVDPEQSSAVNANDVTPPTVSILSPANGATGVAANASVIIRFSETMNTGTINSSTFTLAPSGGSPVAGVIKFHGLNTVTFDVSSPMSSGVTYVVNVTSAAQDLAGNGVSPPLTSSFTIAGVADNTPPTVVGSTPVNGASDVSVNSAVTATFSEAMNAATIGASSVTLAPSGGGSPIAGTVSYNGTSKTVTLTPSAALAFSTSYTLTVTTAVKDVAGNFMASPFQASFTTAAAGDLTPPTVTAVTPVNAATGVAITTNVVVSFSEAMSAGTITTSTFTLTPTSGGSPVAATVAYNAGAITATLTPSSALIGNTDYTVNVTSGAKDVANNGLVPFASTFRTALGVSDVTPPTVTAVAPVNATTGVAVNSSVVVNFSEAMTGSSVTGSTFTLTPTAGGSPVLATVTYNAGPATATLVPSSALATSTSYTVNVTSGARDLADNALTPFSSTFTTAAPADVTPPTVTGVTPLNAATSVAIASNVVVNFSEAMAAGTVTTSTFTLTPTSGGSPVAASVVYGSGSATLNPASDLANNTSYTVSVNSGAEDLANNALTPFSSTFTTVAAGDVTPPTVSMISPTNGATGVATNKTVVFRFSETMNLSTINSSSVTLAPSGGSPVAGVIGYHGLNSVSFDVSSPMSQGTTYVLTVTSGAKDLAGNGVSPVFTGSFTTVGAADVTPPTVTGVTPLNAATNVAIASNVVVNFSEAMSAGTVTTSTFTLTPTSGGSPVAASVVYSAGAATLNPASDLAYSTSYTVNVTNGAKDLANNGLTPFSSTFTTAAAPDLTAPTVTGVTPLNAATNVAIASNVVVNFSEAMNAGTVTTSTFTLTPTSGGSPVTASVVYSAGSATLNPTADLAYGTSYTVNVTNGAKDLANNGLTPFSSTFTTTAAPDLTAPTVTGVTPLNLATNVVVASNVVVNFSEAMNAGTVTTSTFTLTPTSGGSPIAASVIYSAGSATLDPAADLAYNTSYTVNVTSGARDLANNGLTPFSSQFTTAPAPDLTSPTVTSVTPVNSATNVAVASNVVVTFSEVMNSGTVTTSTFTLTPTSGGSPVTASVVYSSGSATLDPTSNLAFSTSYTVNVTSGAKDLANNGLVPFSSTFTTAAAPDLTPPTVTTVSPLNNATNVAVAANVVVNFSEAMNAGTVTTSTFTLTPTAGGSPVPASVVYSSGSATLNPTSNLAFSTGYTVNVTSGAKDLANNGLTPFSSSFTTVAPPDVTAPTIVTVSPANRSVNISTTAQVRVTFSEPIDPATITATTFKVKEFLPNAPFISGTRSYDPATNTIIFTSSNPFKNHESYWVQVTTGVKDIAGNALAAAMTSCFTPTAGTGTVIGLTGFWSGNDACLDGHWHMKIVQTGNTLSLGSCTGDECLVYGVSPTGVQALGGDTCPPSNAGGPVLCKVDIVSLTGSVNGSAITFTFTTSNGLSFTFNGTYSATTGNGNPYLTGTISGGFMQAAGMQFERQGL